MSTSASSSGGGGERRRRRRRRNGSGGAQHYDYRRNNQFEVGESSSRERFHNEVWPEPFLEALAFHVATDAARTHGRLAAAPALSNFFQVCSTWQAISRSNHLWKNLTPHIWRSQPRLIMRGTWREEYIALHQTSSNFRTRKAEFTNLLIRREQDGNGNAESLTCRRLALSEFHLACGLVDGSIRIFSLTTRLYITTLHPQPRDHLGRFSRAVSGIILLEQQDFNFKIVFASLDGDVHVGEGGHGEAPRRVQLGNVVNNGTLVDFTGCRKWWVGLYAGVPGRSFHVWNAQSEELLFVGGSLTDPDSLMGWHLLTDFNLNSLARLRIVSVSTTDNHHDYMVACTATRIISFDLLQYQEHDISTADRRGVIVDSLDVSNMMMVVVDNHRVGRVLQLVNEDYQETCRFRVRGSRGGGLSGCMNGGCAFIATGGAIGVWDIQQGEFLYNLTQRIGGEPTALVANDRLVALAASDNVIYLWDFTAF